MRQVTYLYDDPDRPDRPTGAVWSPEWTDDDRALLLGLDAFEATLCPGGCGEPRAVAWHSEMEGEYECEDEDKFVCHACTARKGHQVVFSTVHRGATPERIAGFPPFELGVTTTPPKPESDET